MAGYKVIKYFEDLTDGRHPYNVGDAFPREGIKVSKERINELSTTKNRRHEVFIEASGSEETAVKEPEKRRSRKK